MNYKNEFKKYATGHMGITSTTVDDVIKHQIEGSVTPMIVEEREMRATIISVFDRLMMDRTLILTGVVDDRMSTTVNAQLLFLESLDRKRDITMMIDSGGGSVKSGLTIYDTMNYISPDVSTINTGMCASMASVLISSGTKGKRSSLIHSKIMTHMVSHGSQGNVQDTRINQMEAEKYNYILFKILAENSGKTFDEIFEISRNDKWFNSHESLQFGLIDEIIGVDKSTSIDSRLEGFEEYYMKEVLKKS
jgi:ATP-dependent Clp protease, protease subunit